MVNYIPANQPFYPTDHCGVLRVKTPEILPEYMALALQAEGEYAKFSRNNRASIRRVGNLSVSVPPLDEQQKIADEIAVIDRQIHEQNAIIENCDNAVKAQFVKMFGMPGTNEQGWGLTPLGKCCQLNPVKPKNLPVDIECSFVAMPSVSENGIVDTSIFRPYAEVSKGFTYFAENDVLFAKITPCMENGKGGVAVGLKNGLGFGSTEFHVLRPIYGKSNPYWLYTITSFTQFRADAEKVMTGSVGQRRVPVSFLADYKVSLPPIDLQDQFAIFAKHSDKAKQEAMDRKSTLLSEREAAISRYFRD